MKSGIRAVSLPCYQYLLPNMNTFKAVLFFCLGFVLFQACTTEENEAEITDLVYYNPFDKKDDTVFWVGNDGYQFAEQKGGYYYFKSLDGKTRFNAPYFDVQGGDNYSVEVLIGAETPHDSVFYGLTLGPVGEKGTFIDFKINKKGESSLMHESFVRKGKFKKPEGEFVKLEIRKMGALTHFYLEESKVFSYEFDPVQKLRTGPLTGEQGYIWIDYIKINKTGKSQ